MTITELFYPSSDNYKGTVGLTVVPTRAGNDNGH